MRVSGQLHVLALYPWDKSPWKQVDGRLGRPQSQSGCGDKERKSLPGTESWSSSL